LKKKRAKPLHRGIETSSKMGPKVPPKKTPKSVKEDIIISIERHTQLQSLGNMTEIPEQPTQRLEHTY